MRRFLLASLVTITIALAIAGFGIQQAFQNHLWTHESIELGHEIDKLVAHLQPDSQGQAFIEATPSNPLYEKPYGGAYWQVKSVDQIVLRSRSLWDFELESLDDKSGKIVGADLHVIKGPVGQSLFAVEKSVVLTTDAGDKRLTVMAAIDSAIYERAIDRFRNQLFLYLAFLTALLFAASIIQVQFGLKPFRDIEQDIAQVKSKSGQRVRDIYPREVRPLVLQMNDLLALRENAAEQARHRAADLAHGLKTPVSSLKAIARELNRKGDHGAAEDIGHQADIIHRRAMYEISKAKAASAGHYWGQTTQLRPVLMSIIETVNRTSDRDIEFELEVSKDVHVPMIEDDLLEVFGVLIDNASKWAKTKVVIASAPHSDAGGIGVQVIDDGDGGQLAAKLAFNERGQRYDSSVPGTGFGLAIARDVIRAYGGRLDFEKAQTNSGLVVKVSFPPQDKAAAL
jgi:signal transduction histidine kinase